MREVGAGSSWQVEGLNLESTEAESESVGAKWVKKRSEQEDSE